MTTDLRTRTIRRIANKAKGDKKLVALSKMVLHWLGEKEESTGTEVNFYWFRF